MEHPPNLKELSSNRHSLISLLFFVLVSLPMIGQNTDLSFKIKIGLVLEFGTHINRLGVLASSATNIDATQFNAELKGYYNFKSYGPPLKGIETVWSLGLAQGVGKKSNDNYPLVDSRYFNTGKRYSLGFTFRKYQDRIETSQSTGTIYFNADAFFLNFENDLFGNTHGKDRFRTGGVSLNYFHDRWLYSLKNIIWTGETRCHEKVSYTDTDYPSRYGYHDVTKCKYGNYAHGIGAFSVSYIPEDWFGQFFSFSMGIDHEQIRHFFQNRLIHDMYFVPDGINPSRNLHYPMLDTEGNPYLFLKDQVLKKPKWYFQLGANTHDLY